MYPFQFISVLELEDKPKLDTPSSLLNTLELIDRRPLTCFFTGTTGTARTSRSRWHAWTSWDNDYVAGK